MITKEVFEEQKALSNRWKEMYYEKKNKLDKLTNNWNELEEWIKEMSMGTCEYNIYDEIRDKMKEIKDSNDNE